MRDYRSFLNQASLVLMLSLFASCAVGINVSGSRFDSPEALGGAGTFKANAGGGSRHYVNLTKNQLTPDTQTPSIEYRDFYPAYGGAMSLGRRLDVEWEGLNTFKLKYQAIGRPQREAVEGDFSMALSAGAGYFTEAQELAGDNLLGFSDKDLMGVLYEGALIMGYRPSNSTMLYGGPFFVNRSYTVFYDPNASAIFTAEHYRDSKTGRINQYGANLGIELRWKSSSGKSTSFLLLESTYTNTIAGESKRDNVFAGFMAGVIF